MSLPTIHSLFVYGTLKEGHLRENVWPRRPVRISPATVQACLYDLGPYPAIGPGSDWVLGEVWEFHDEDMPETLRVLDLVEGYAALGSDNEYQRIEATAFLNDATRVSVYTYQFADLRRLPRLRRIQAWVDFGDKRCASWPDQESQVPNSIADESRWKR